MKSEIAYALNQLGLRPQTWDIGGWAKLAQKHNLPVNVIDLQEDESLPTSRKDFEQAVIAHKDSLSREAGIGSLMLDADKTVTAQNSTEIIDGWLAACESKLFPAYVDTVSVLVKKFLTENFRFRYAKDGSPIVYRRNPEAEGTIWLEVEDSTQPFTTLQGALRMELEKCLVATSKAKEVDVYFKKNGEVHYATNIPFYKLYIRFREEIFNTIKGRADNVQRIKNLVNNKIEDLKRQHEGDLSRGEIEGGLKNVDEMLSALNNKLNSFGFIYDADFEPKLLTNDPAVDAYAYFDLNKLQDGPTPDFDGFLDAVVPECRESLMAAIYATVYAPSQLNQYIWLHGEGGDGKSSFLNALRKYLGGNLACSLGQTLNSDFGLEDAVGKRMVILSDVKTGLSVKSQLIHNLTGHDPISINRKNKPIITTVLEPIVWIAANESPDVNFDAENEARRCLYIKMRTPSEKTLRKFSVLNKDGSFRLDSKGRRINNGYNLTGGLLKEMPAILYKCQQVFFKVSPPPYSVIVQNNQQHSLAVEQCVDIDADAWAFYIEEAFEFDAESVMPLPEAMEAVQDVRSLHGEKSALTNFQKRDIRRLLINKYDCRVKTIDGYRKVCGIRRKE